MIFYLSSNWASQQRTRENRARLKSRGHVVRSGWLDESSAQAFDSLTLDQRRDYSYRDIGEIATVDVFVIDLLEPSPTGGREVEYGFALGHGVEVWTVGEPRNIFHTIAARRFEDWEELVDFVGQDWGPR